MKPLSPRASTRQGPQRADLAVRKPGSTWTELPPARERRRRAGRTLRLGYARASTARQSRDVQAGSLAEAGMTRVFSEWISTGATKRPEL